MAQLQAQAVPFLPGGRVLGIVSLGPDWADGSETTVECRPMDQAMVAR